MAKGVGYEPAMDNGVRRAGAATDRQGLFVICCNCVSGGG